MFLITKISNRDKKQHFSLILKIKKYQQKGGQNRYPKYKKPKIYPFTPMSNNPISIKSDKNQVLPLIAYLNGRIKKRTTFLSCPPIFCNTLL